MKYRYTTWYFRLLAFALAAVCIAIGFLSGLDAIYCAAEGYYFGQEKYFQTTWQCSETARNKGWDIIEKFRRDPEYTDWRQLLEDSDLRFILVEEHSGDVVAQYTTGLGITVPDNMAGNAYLYEYNTNMALGEKGTFLDTVFVCDYYFGTDQYGNPWGGFSSEYKTGEVRFVDGGYEITAVPVEATREASREQITSYQILYLLPQTLHFHDGDPIWETYNVFRVVRSWGGSTPIIFAVCLVAFLAVLVFLLVTAGRRPGEEEIKAFWPERIPTDLLIILGCLAAVGIVGCISIAADFLNNTHITVDELWFYVGLCAAGSTVCGTFLLAILRSFVIRFRLRCFWKSMWMVQLLCWGLRLLGKVFRSVFGFLIRGIRSVGLVPGAVLDIVLAFLAEVLLLVWADNVQQPLIPALLLVVLNSVLIFALIWGAAQMKLLQDAAKALADGDLERKLNTDKMYWEFWKHGENLNAIADGMNKAVEQRIKSERLKTELITNVSHDIKTPLTSIVNYVDLLQKPHTEAEALQYLEVLDRQSKRLKKLTENLVEASKASTGNLPVELQPTSVLELLNQAVEEYRDRLEAGKLEIVMALRGDLTIMADGKHMWRIMDNLLNNVVKYAMAGTRVYVTAEKREDRVVIAVKNISREPLNISADELMERFVRGDSSRSTEGSGLGLNIARSLTLLQNGAFSLTVDGDFFKAEVSLPVV